MTAHYLEPDLSRKSVALACSRLLGRHTFDVLAKVIENKLKEFCIHNKCVGVVTDNASNFVKAFVEYSGDSEEEDNADDDEDDPIALEETGNLLDSMDDAEEIYHLPTHYRCAAHTLNLISIKNAESALTDATYKKLYRSTLAKYQAAWNKQQRSPQMADKVREKCGLLFRVHVVTRWNSLYYAFERVNRFVQESGDNLDSLMDALELERFREAEVQFMAEYLDVMKPFAQALNVLQGEKNCYTGYLLPTIQLLKKKLRRKEDDLSYCKPLVNALCTGIDVRFASQIQDRKYMLAAFLIPQFKNLNWVDTEDTKNAIIEEVKKEVTSLRKDDSGNSDNDSGDDFFPTVDTHTVSTADLVNQFCAARFQTIDGLKDYPEFYELFRKYNTVITSSASVERLFSHAGGIFGKNRHGLSEEPFERQLLLKLNNGCF